MNDSVLSVRQASVRLNDAVCAWRDVDERSRKVIDLGAPLDVRVHQRKTLGYAEPEVWAERWDKALREVRAAWESYAQAMAERP